MCIQFTRRWKGITFTIKFSPSYEKKPEEAFLGDRYGLLAVIFHWENRGGITFTHTYPTGQGANCYSAADRLTLTIMTTLAAVMTAEGK